MPVPHLDSKAKISICHTFALSEMQVPHVCEKKYGIRIAHAPKKVLQRPRKFDSSFNTGCGGVVCCVDVQ